MKTLISIWCVTFLLYLLSSIVHADNFPHTNEKIWVGNNVVGDVCVEVVNTENDTPALAELWLINHNGVQWFEAVRGYKCLDIALSKTTELHAITYDASSDVTVVNDNTSTYFVIDLPI